MDRREFVQSCATSTAVACMAAHPSSFALAVNARPKAYDRVLLTDELGRPIKASELRAKVNYVFHYPFEATPAFLLDLGRSANPVTLKAKDGSSYTWPGGVGAKRSIVAFSAICAHMKQSHQVTQNISKTMQGEATGQGGAQKQKKSLNG